MVAARGWSSNEVLTANLSTRYGQDLRSETPEVKRPGNNRWRRAGLNFKDEGGESCLRSKRPLI